MASSSSSAAAAAWIAETSTRPPGCVAANWRAKRRPAAGRGLREEVGDRQELRRQDGPGAEPRTQGSNQRPDVRVQAPAEEDRLRPRGRDAAPQAGVAAGARVPAREHDHVEP